MIVKRDDAADVLPWEPLPFDEEPVLPIETRWLSGTYPWEEEDECPPDTTSSTCTPPLKRN